MRLFTLIAVVAAVALTPVYGQQQGAPPQKPDPKADAKEAPTVAGRWSVAIQTDQGERLATMTLAVEGKKLTGTMASEMGEAPISGEYAEKKLTFYIAMQTSNGEFSLAFAGALKDDGTLAGTMDYGQGAINWTATRSKEK